MSKKLIHQKQKILEKIGKLERMRRGKLSSQFYKRTGKDSEEKLLGPYFKLQCWIGGKNHTERLPAHRVDQIRKDVANYELFKKMCEEFVVISEKLTANVDKEGK